MLVVAVMLACALWSTGYINTVPEFYKDLSVNITFPAGCLLQPQVMQGYHYNYEYVIIVLLFLSISYCTRILQLFKDLPKFKIPVYSRMQKKASDLLRRVKNKAAKASRSRMLWILLLRAILAFSCVFQAVTNLYQSVLWEVYYPMN